MAKRSITDGEISLIKAMLKRGYKNQEIQFHFNRPDRPVNSGRITGIRNGSYANAAKVAAAPDADLDAFLLPSQPQPAPIQKIEEDPLSLGKIGSFFHETAGGFWRLIGDETDVCECKAGFGFKHQDKWLRPIAALANNAGGYVFFGVKDKDAKGPNGEDHSGVVTGLDTNEFGAADPADFATRVKSMFDPTPSFRTTTVEIGGKTIGVIHVLKHNSRPVIATKQEGTIKEGDIFYRYPGQSSRIKYSDLRSILDARDAEARAQILPMVERLLQLGPARSMVADLEEGTLVDGNRTVQIDESLLEKLTFIKEGQFSEIEGAPTLRLIGDVSAVDGHKATQQFGVLTRDGILAAFLDQTVPENPKEYIRFALQVGQGERLPLHYFARLADLAGEPLKAFIEDGPGTVARKKRYIGWLEPNAAYHAAVGTPKALLAKIVAGEVPTATNPTEAGHVGQAIQSLPDKAGLELATLVNLLKTCMEISRDTPPASHVRRAVCRVDELWFGTTGTP